MGVMTKSKMEGFSIICWGSNAPLPLPNDWLHQPQKRGLTNCLDDLSSISSPGIESHLPELGTVSVSFGCYNKLPQTWWLNTHLSSHSSGG